MSESDPELMNRKFTLTAETELRLEVGPSDTVTISLESGDAECFGTELANAEDKTYKVSNCRLALFTWHGCEISVNGVVSHIYTGTETPYPTYVNLHTQLERLRAIAEAESRQGPRVMVVGRDGTGMLHAFI
jgi:polyribonucleotide 5'-hydroxyl-kinase